MLQIQIASSVVNSLRSEYYDTDSLTDLKLTRIDSTVNFSWGTGSSSSTTGSDSFLVRWTGQVQPKTSGNYTFFTQADDGVRLWVSGRQLINDWEDGGVVAERRGTIRLTAGQKYDIKLEYFAADRQAVAKLLWSGLSQAKQLIP